MKPNEKKALYEKTLAEARVEGMGDGTVVLSFVHGRLRAQKVDVRDVDVSELARYVGSHTALDTYAAAHPDAYSKDDLDRLHAQIDESHFKKEGSMPWAR